MSQVNLNCKTKLMGLSHTLRRDRIVESKTRPKNYARFLITLLWGCSFVPTKLALEMRDNFLFGLWEGLRELLTGATYLLVPGVAGVLCVQRSAQIESVMLQVIIMKSSPVTDYPSSQPLILIHDCYGCLGFMRPINMNTLGSSLNPSRKGFISLSGCLQDSYYAQKVLWGIRSNP